MPSLRLLVTLPAVAGLLAHVACSASSTPASTLREAEVPRDTSPAVPEADQSALALGNARFAFDVYGKLATDDTQNLVYSPVSMSIALSMAYAAAKGVTATQMAAASTSACRTTGSSPRSTGSGSRFRAARRRGACPGSP